MDFSPQLRMLRPTLADLPALALPEGFSVRSYQAGDGAHWERILEASFGGEPGRFSFERIMRQDLAFRPERVLFVVAAGLPVATAAAWRVPGLLPETGMVHYVGAVPEYQGKRLGYWITLATLHRMVVEGLRAASLTTDDFRVPAVKTYLRLGFEPMLVHENQRERWRLLLRQLQLPEMEARFAAILSGPVWQPPDYPADEVDYSRQLVRRRRQHPDRPAGAMAGQTERGAGDESLYRPALLGRAGASVTEVEAGVSVPLELWFEAGPAGVPTGSTLLFEASGPGPRNAVLPAAGSAVLARAVGRLPGTARVQALPSPRLGFVVAEGALAPRERVTLPCGGQAGWQSPTRAGRLEIRTLIDPGQGEPSVRLPEPVVIRVVAGAPARAEAFLPGTAAAGEEVEASVQITDRFGNPAGPLARGRVRCAGRTLALPRPGGTCRLPVGRMGPTPRSCRVSVPGLPPAISNITVPRPEEGLGLFFGDLQAPGSPQAADRGWLAELPRLDFVALVPPARAWLDNEGWALLKQAADGALDEGRLVTFLSFAWPHSHYGSRAVHFLGSDQPYLPVDDPRYNHPARLYEALRATDALVVGRPPWDGAEQTPPRTDWKVLEADVERLVQIWSTDSSDPAGGTAAEAWPEPAWEEAVLGALRAGVRVGFTGGSGPASAPGRGGLCAVWAERLTRRALFAALRARRTYALSGRRIGLRFTVNDVPMGAELPFSRVCRLRVQAWSEVRLATVEVARNALPWRSMAPGTKHFDDTFEDTLDRPAFYHARVTLADGSRAICSPVWIG